MNPVPPGSRALSQRTLDHTPSFRTVSVRRIFGSFLNAGKVAYSGGERGIRTLEGLLTLTPLAEQAPA